MNLVLTKIFATALAFSQVTTQPDAIRTQFDATTDREAVVRIIRAGCDHMRKAFDIEDLNLDDLVSTAMDDPQALTAEIKALRGVNFGELHLVYRQFCKGEAIADSPIDIGEVIAFYNKAAADLPDHNRLKGFRLPGITTVLDRKGERFAELYQPRSRRIWVPLSDIPETVQKAFVAAEDKRFYQHHGIDERGVIRAFLGNLTQPGRPQGGSTITQQVVKNVLVGTDVTYERKIREMIVAARVEQTLRKGDILEVYLNSIYLGRGAWGIEMAARSYYGKPAKELGLAEAAFLAGLAKGPSYFNPDRHPRRSNERTAYVLTRMEEDGMISAEARKAALADAPKRIAYTRVRRDSGFHFIDHVRREAREKVSIESLTAQSLTVHATLDPVLQEATEAALQEGLARYERNTGRYRFEAAEANLAEAIKRITEKEAASAKESAGPTESASATEAADPAAPKPEAEPKPWQRALAQARLPLYDVHWEPAVVIAKEARKGDGETVQVGLIDGRTMPLTVGSGSIRRKRALYDVVYVQVREASRKRAASAELRTRPQVQGAALILENKTGRILGMAGAFSYPLSQLNRVTQTRRQPGSALKPLTYLAALRNGLQPNTLVSDTPITLPPIGNVMTAREQDYWSPKNYDNTGSGVVTLRRGLERSRNLVTARLLDGGIAAHPPSSLDKVCELAMEARIYKECERFYPFVLGAQAVRLIDLAAFYAGVANEGRRPEPHAIDSISRDGKVVYRHDDAKAISWIGTPDQAAMYQLKTMLQGVLARGTAIAARHLAPYVAGKTGTSDEENDAWFVGFTNDITVAVWVGYDNATSRRTLGSGQTGASAALPIFVSIVQAAWANGIPKTPLSPPSAEARRHLATAPINVATGERVQSGTPEAFTEYFHLDPSGAFKDTQYSLVSREDVYASRDYGDYGRSGWNDPNDGRYFNDQPGYYQPQRRPRSIFESLFGTPPRWDEEERERALERARRRDPDVFWRNRQFQ